MTGLGLLAQPGAHAGGPLRLEGRGDGRRVLILGGGLAGLAAAYELGKLGYRCRILEARERPGGRSWTIRGGDRFREVDGTEQQCRFDPGHYLNPGPARIPQWHVTLDYCKELGVAVEPFAMRNESAYYHHQGGPLGGRPIQARAVRADMRGYLAEALAKAVHLDDLELPLSAEDRDRRSGRSTAASCERFAGAARTSSGALRHTAARRKAVHGRFRRAQRWRALALAAPTTSRRSSGDPRRRATGYDFDAPGDRS
ncbi:MAG: FAD-dependent oxidoreductase [Pseudomonadota bacterium]